VKHLYKHLYTNIDMIHKIKFQGKVWRAGDSYVLTVPSAFIKFNLIDIRKKYDIILREKINKR